MLHITNTTAAQADIHEIITTLPQSWPILLVCLLSGFLLFMVAYNRFTAWWNRKDGQDGCGAPGETGGGYLADREAYSALASHRYRGYAINVFGCRAEKLPAYHDSFIWFVDDDNQNIYIDALRQGLPHFNAAAYEAFKTAKYDGYTIYAFGVPVAIIPVPEQGLPLCFLEDYRTKCIHIMSSAS